MSSEPFERDDEPKAERAPLLRPLLERAAKEWTRAPQYSFQSSLMRVTLIVLIWIVGAFLASIATALAIMLIVVMGKALHIW